MKQILFNTAMVQAILEGRKTCSRRVIKDIDSNYSYLGSDKQKTVVSFTRNTTGLPLKIKIPYKTGDILYVRETWKQYEKRVGKGENCCLAKFYGYKADKDKPGNPSEFYEGNWKPSIHMPKAAARIFLKVTDVRVEKLQDMKLEDYQNEGITFEEAINFNDWKPTLADPDSGGDPNYEEAFKNLWDSTLKKDQLEQYGFNANPWVWVIKFERCDKPNE